jgi:hypothetical protein
MVTSLVRLVDYLVNNYLAESTRFFNFFALNIMANRGARVSNQKWSFLSRQVGINLRGFLCDVLAYASAQPLDFLDLGKNSSFLNWNRFVPQLRKWMGTSVVQDHGEPVVSPITD